MKLKMVYSVTWYTGFATAFITFKILYGFMVQAYVYLDILP